MTELSFPRLCALCGERPTRLSQAMHNAGFRHLGLAFTYVAFDTDDTAFALEAMRRLGIRGLSLTMPHKERALSYLDEISDEVRSIGAANTIVNDSGNLSGHNTDVDGVEQAFREARVDIRGRRVLLIGAGGAARAAAMVLKKSDCSRVVVISRSVDRAARFSQEFDFECAPVGSESLRLSNFDILMNMTPLGSKQVAAGIEDYPIDTHELGSTHVVFDAVTNETPLTEEARRRSAGVISGDRMLLFQALSQFRLFTGEAIDPAIFESALEAERRR